MWGYIITASVVVVMAYQYWKIMIKQVSSELEAKYEDL